MEGMLMAPVFEVYYSQGNDYRWRLKAGNGEIVAVGEGHTTKASAKRSAERVRELAPTAYIQEI